MQKTNKDLLAAYAGKIGGFIGDPLLETIFGQQLIPMVSDAKDINNPIPDAEFAAHLAAFERNLPRFVEYLKTRKIAKPPTFDPKN